MSLVRFLLLLIFVMPVLDVLATPSLPKHFVLIKPGTFMMGNDWHPAESPAHRVILQHPFFISDHEVTVGEYRRFDSDAKSHQCEEEDCPVYASWNDMQSYLLWLEKTQPIDGGRMIYRLCTEAEWEYAARAGTTTTWFCGNDPSCLESYAWFNKPIHHGARPVKTKKPNPWGLYDMLGNMMEWVDGEFELYSPNEKIASQKPEFPIGKHLTIGIMRILRGGSFVSLPQYLRSASRTTYEARAGHKDAGFRLCVSKRFDAAKIEKTEDQ